MILDEANELLKNPIKRFTSSDKKNEASRLLYTIIIWTYTFFLALCILPSGTGLSIKSAKMYTGSHLIKGDIKKEGLIIIDCGFNSVRDVHKYIF